MNPKTPFRLDIRIGVLWCALALSVTSWCWPAAAQERVDESSSREVAVTAPPAAGAAASQGASTAAHGCDIISAPLTCIGDVFHDQAGIWTSPARARQRDALWILPVVGAGLIAYNYDAQTMAALGASPSRVRISNDFSDIGSGYALAGAAGAIYALGKITHNERARETGVVALEALADAGIVSEGIKLATNRFRPNAPRVAGIFWPDDPTKPGDVELYSLNSSFPSGHATATWAVMHVLVDETPGHRWLHVGLYALAAGVSVARVTGRDHFPSDVVAGSAIGYLVGGYVYRRHSQYYATGVKSVSISPIYNSATRSYGVGLSLVP